MGALVVIVVVLIWLGMGAATWHLIRFVHRTFKTDTHEYHNYKCVGTESDGDYITYTYDCCVEGDSYETKQYVGK